MATHTHTLIHTHDTARCHLCAPSKITTPDISPLSLRLARSRSPLLLSPLAQHTPLRTLFLQLGHQITLLQPIPCSNLIKFCLFTIWEFISFFLINYFAPSARMAPPYTYIFIFFFGLMEINLYVIVRQ